MNKFKFILEQIMDVFDELIFIFIIYPLGLFLTVLGAIWFYNYNPKTCVMAGFMVMCFVVVGIVISIVLILIEGIKTIVYNYKKRFGK